MTIAPKSAFHISRLTGYVLLVTLLLLALFLRFYRLDAQSFWNDEGNSARIAERPIRLILEGAAGDIHPPGYYLLLHYWRAMVGHSEFALRALSAMASVIMVTLTYLLGCRLFGSLTGLIAALLGVISPLAVYYAQEARMYALLGALSAISSYLLLRLLTRPSLAIGAAYVLAGAAGLYTHYAFPFILIVHNVTFGLWWLAQTRRAAPYWRRLALWAGVQIAVVTLYLPWLPTTFRSITGWSPAGRTYDLAPALLDILRVLSVGITLPTNRARIALVSAGLLLAASLWPTRQSAEAHRKATPLPLPNVAFVALYLLLPVILIFAFDLYKPQWLKFLIVILPPFHVLLAHSIEKLSCSPASRILSLVSCTLLLTLCIPTYSSLYNLYFNPKYYRDDYRLIAADLSARMRPSDAVILNAPNQWEVFTYYAPDRDIYPAPYRPTAEEVDAFLNPLTERYRCLFVLYWGDAESDPGRLIETALAAHTYKAGDRWYGRVRLATYGVAPLPEEPSTKLDVQFGEQILLNGYALPDVRVAAGDILPVTLFWKAQAPIAERYKVTVQLLDETAQLVAQVDTEPRDGLKPTTIWEPEQTLVDRYGLLIPSNLPAGHYTVAVGLYHIVTGERLSVTLDGRPGGDHLSLTDVYIP